MSATASNVSASSDVLFSILSLLTEMKSVCKDIAMLKTDRVAKEACVYYLLL